VVYIPIITNTYSGWGIVNHRVPQGSDLGPLRFLIYINDLPATINSTSKPIIFAHDTSIIIVHQELIYLENIMNDVLANINKWFRALNFERINFMKFVTKHKTYPDKFLGLQVDSNLNCKKHIEYIIPKLSFAMRTVISLMKIDTLKLVCFANFHSVVSYGLIF
jgi:hypothetical protein